MPDSNGKLSLEEKGKIQAFISQRAPASSCPVCGSNVLFIADNLLYIPIYTTGPSGTPTMKLGTGFPAALLVCSNCGFFQQHSAIMMGVIQPDKPKAGG